MGVPVIAEVRALDSEQQRQLIRLLDPRADLDDVTQSELLAELLAVLRRVLEVPAKDDLPEYLRRRLVDVAGRQFQLADSFDAATDMEVAQVLVDFVLDAAQTLAGDAERRGEFETFLRTKDKTERTRWLVQSQKFAALFDDDEFDRHAAESRAAAVLAEPGAHRETARAILDDLKSISVKSNARLPPSRKGLSARAAAAGIAATALAPTVAMPLGALAGGLFMAGRARSDLVKLADVEAAKTRAQRARRSKLVQNVVTLCAFLVVHGRVEAEGEGNSEHSPVRSAS